MKKLTRLAVVVALLAASAAAGALLCYRLMPRGESVEAVSVSLGGAINGIGELATAEYGYTMAQTANKPHREIMGFKIPLTSSKVVYSYDGLIKAGIDFAEISVSADEDAKTVTVSLPEPRILSSEVDGDSLVVFDEQNSPFNAITFEDMNLSVGELKSAAEKDAVAGGLLDRASANAEKLLRTTVGGFFDLDEYTLEFK